MRSRGRAQWTALSQASQFAEAHWRHGDNVHCSYSALSVTLEGTHYVQECLEPSC
ncbi:hypothetical protein AURDEDRAFT_115410 [Auricularia subglabra TFB-10046 SS5]|nr:hypothetical protein AURDEDRAFT_115410 [Auricularia subglabra TFB-10046 SS5]